MPSANIDDLIRILAGSEPLTSAEIRAKLGISQPSTSRLIAGAGDRVLRLGAARSSRYTLTASVFGVQPHVDLYEVDASGIVQYRAVLRQTSTGAFVVDGEDLPFWMLGANGDGIFRGLPFFLADLRPAGFLGRLTARREAPALGAPEDPRRWTDEHIGRFLLRSGVDLPGSLVVGGHAAQAANQARFTTVDDREKSYPELVQRNLNGELPGSSAQGEQPKFLAWVEGAGHVVVKYSDPVDTVAGRLWSDLLVAESQALQVIRANGLPAVESRVFAIEGRTYLETTRFDRADRRGRHPAHTLGMVDAEFIGEGSGWSSIASGLRQRRLLDAESAEGVAWLETFGRWIGNTDMHAGNLSLRPDAKSYSLWPVYDMLPMRLSRPGEALDSIELAPPVRRRTNVDVWEATGLAAAQYWQQLADTTELSSDFRSFADRHGRQWSSLLGG